MDEAVIDETDNRLRIKGYFEALAWVDDDALTDWEQSFDATRVRAEHATGSYTDPSG